MVSMKKNSLASIEDRSPRCGEYDMSPKKAKAHLFYHKYKIKQIAYSCTMLLGE